MIPEHRVLAYWLWTALEQQHQDSIQKAMRAYNSRLSFFTLRMTSFSAPPDPQKTLEIASSLGHSRLVTRLLLTYPYLDRQQATLCALEGKNAPRIIKLLLKPKERPSSTLLEFAVHLHRWHSVMYLLARGAISHDVDIMEVISTDHHRLQICCQHCYSFLGRPHRAYTLVRLQAARQYPALDIALFGHAFL